jgi:uncharacterized membrane protein YbhN (UPF0104 family)
VNRLIELAGRVLGAGRKPAVRLAVGGLAVALAVWAVAAEWDEVTAALHSLDPEAVLLALVATVVNVALAGMVWRTVLADLGSRVPLVVAARIFFVGQLGKYVPGSVWPIVMQAELGRDHGVPRQRTATATLVSLLLSVASALLVVLLALPFDSRVVPPGFEWAVVLVVPLLVMLHPKVLAWLLDRVLRLAKREPLENRTSLRGTALATLWAIGSWTGAGMQVYCLAVALGAPPGIDTASLAIGGYTLAWAVGFVVVVAPAGAGAREVALAAVLAPVLTSGEVIVVVLVSRLLFTGVDLAAAGLGLAVGHRHRVPVDVA